MKNYFIFFFFIAHYSFSQSINLLFKDSISNEPIEFVKAYSLKSKKITFSSKIGELKNILISDTLFISCPGYFTKKVSQISINETILLSPIIIQLPEVIISNKKIETLEYGYHKNKLKKTSINFYGNISAVYIPTPSKKDNSIFKELFFKVKNKGKKNHINVRPIIYSIDEYGKIDTQLINENLTIKIDKKDLYIIDISHLQIVVPENGIYLGLELVEGTESLEIGFGVIDEIPNASRSYYIIERENDIWSTNLNMKHKNENYINFLYGFSAINSEN